MAAKRPPVIRVAVCGLTSSTFFGMSGQGAGKSFLCNRFVRPKKDDLCLNHTSLMTHSDFGSSVVNNGHFLYWGEKTVGLEDGPVAFQIVEHTEFVEDGTLHPFPAGKPYHKRCIQLKLTSGGKVQYVHPDQLVVPEDYANVEKFPDKFVVDGFIICIDVSVDLNNPKSQQRECLDRLLPTILTIKRAHVVIAFTKFDIAKEASIAAANELLAKCKRQATIIEVSALKGVNVDVCFLVLAHLVDSKKPRTRVSSFAEADAHLKERIRKNEETFQKVLTGKITDFSLSLLKARAMVENEVEFQLLRELCGKDRVDRLIKAQLRYLKERVVKNKLVHFLDHLRASLQLFLPVLSLSDSLETCKEMIRSHEKFFSYFLDCKEWRDDFTILKEEQVSRVPFSVLEEPEGQKVLKERMDRVMAPLREEAACEVIRTTLHNTADLIPGRPMEEVLKELGLAEQLAAVFSPQKAIGIYQERMAEVEQECVYDINELLLENPNLFTLSEQDALTTITTQLKDDRRYKRLEQHAGARTSAIIKHIGTMKWPDKSSFAEPHILEDDLLLNMAPSQENLSGYPSQSDQPNPSDWILDSDGRVFNLAVLGRTNDNALTLRSDFMNHLSGSGVCEVGRRKYQLELAVFHGNITTLRSEKFTPQGAVAVVNSNGCLNWLERVLELLWIPGGDMPPYRGLPLVILALDDLIIEDDVGSGLVPDTPLCKRAKQLADSVQCVLMTERPTVQPKRLVVSSVISPLLTSLIDSVSSYADFATSDLVYKKNGLNIAMCTLAGDLYSPQDLLSPWLQHQAVCRDEEGKSLFINCAMEKQHRSVNMSFHSSLNILDLKKKIHAGYILVYSPLRRASIAILRHILPQLPQIPMLIVAMVTEQSCDSHVTQEGLQLAEQYGALFLTSSSPHWAIGYSSGFFSKCWFSRFTSWQCQNYNPRGNMDRPLPQPVTSVHSSMHDLTDDTPSSVPTPRPPPLPSSQSHSSLRPQSFAGVLDMPPPNFTPPPPLPSPPLNSGSLPRPLRKAGFKPTGATSPEDEIYSNPADIAMGTQQKKATLQRRQDRQDHTLPRTPVTPISPNHPILMHLTQQQQQQHPSAVEDTYADPKDSIRFPFVSQEAPLKSPGISPPPPPLITPPAVTNGNRPPAAEEDLYDVVQPAVVKKNLLSPTSPVPGSAGVGRGYDHLLAMKWQQSGRYDHLALDQGGERTSEGGPGGKGLDERSPAPKSERPPAPLPENPPVSLPVEPENMYATVDTSTKIKRKPRGYVPAPEVNDLLYAKVSKPQRKQVPPPLKMGGEVNRPRENSGHVEEMYATVDVSKKRKKSLPTAPVAGGDMNRKPPASSPPTVARGNHSNAGGGESDQLYATVDVKRKRKKTPPIVLPKSPRSPVDPPQNGGEFTRGSLDRQRKATPQLVNNGGHFRRKSNDTFLTPAGGSSLRGVPGGTEGSYMQQTQHYHPDNAANELYAMPSRKLRKPPPPTAPKPNSVSISGHSRTPSEGTITKSLPWGKSLDIASTAAGGNPTRNPRKTWSPQLRRKHPHLLADMRTALDPRLRTFSDPYGGKSERLGGGGHGVRARKIVKAGSSDNVLSGPGEGVRAGSSDNVWRGHGEGVRARGVVRAGSSDNMLSGPVRAGSSDNVWRGHGEGVRAGSSDNVWRGHGEGVRGEPGDDVDASAPPVIPKRQYSASEMGLEDEPPPLPPRNYEWSDVEEDDEDLFQSDDDLDEPSSQISLDDQHAMYSSLRQYQKRTNSISGIEELYAIVNQVAKEQEATMKPSSRPSPAENEAANVYDTLESALKQKEQLVTRKEVSAALHSTGSFSSSSSSVSSASSSGVQKPPPSHSALGALSGTGPTFTAKQLKLIKQQQKLLDKLQKKTEREAVRRRRSEVRRRKREDDEQRKRDGHKKGKKGRSVKEPERQRYFGSPLDKVVESDGVPRFIKQCTQIIEAQGLKIEGIYRVSGKKDVCLELQEQYDQDSEMDVAAQGLCETAISSTLKAFFKLLPYPLIPNGIATKVLDTSADSLAGQKRELGRILQEMPAPNLCTLRYLLLHLHRVQKLNEVNKMTSSNLAIVFWPTLMRPPLSDLADPSKQLGWQLTMARLIEHPDIVPEVL